MNYFGPDAWPVMADHTWAAEIFAYLEVQAYDDPHV